MPEHAAAGQGRHLRRLLPASQRAGPSTPIRRELPPKVHAVKLACDACRKRKAKCSGETPACGRCVRLRIRCHYTAPPPETKRHDTLDQGTDQATAQGEIIELLKNLPEKESLDLLQRIRSGTDISTIVNHVKAAGVLVQMAITPETRFRYDFPYRSEMPRDYLSSNPYLDSMIYEATGLFSKDHHQDSSRLAASARVASLAPEYQSLYLKPFHAAEVSEPKLRDVRISRWTTVCSDDALMRDILGVWLRCEYHFTSAFQKDYFLEDMAAGRRDFCSSLLVNAVLGYACICYPKFEKRAEYWNPNTLTYRFIAEAKRLWELEASKAQLTTIHAGVIFNVFHNLCGLDEIGQAYRIQAIALAHQLRLFDCISHKENDDRARNAMAFSAWALFSWETLVGFSFMLSPLLKEPPNWPLPNPSEDAQFYGEIWVHYPLDHSLAPLYFGQTFLAKCQFRIIMNEYCAAAYTARSVVTLEKATRYRSQLKEWFDGLAKPLRPESIVLPGHLQLHMYYHHLLLTIYEPFLDAKTAEVPTPQQIVAESRRYLQTLIRLYYLRHGYESMDLFIVIPLMLSGYECLDALGESTPEAKLEVLRSTLILCAKGLYSQRRNHYLAEALFRVLRGRMRPQEASLLRGSVNLDEEEPEGKQEMVQTVRSHWPVSVVKKPEDFNSHVLGNLVESYAHLNIDGTPAEAQESELEASASTTNKDA